MEWHIGQLVAVMGVVNKEQVRRIGRITELHGDYVTIETDDEIEGEAAIEYDFATPDHEVMNVSVDRLRPIVG